MGISGINSLLGGGISGTRPPLVGGYVQGVGTYPLDMDLGVVGMSGGVPTTPTLSHPAP